MQLLSYFITLFIAPLAIITGVMQAPAIANRLGWFGRVLHRQAARSIHFRVPCWFVFFIFIHVTMIFITGLRQNLNHMFAGVNGNGPEGFVIFCIAMLLVIVVWFAASPFTLRHARLVQKTGEFMVGWIKGFGEWWDPNNQYTEQDISPHFWPNGTMPNSEEFNALVKNGFANYSLRVDGLVERPRVFSFAELKAMPKQEQITEHFCIQGWSGVAKWGGVSMRHILEIVKPTPEAHYAGFYSFSEGSAGGGYYDAHKIENMRHHLTILAYEMNGAPVSVLHGAPLRLRCENELGFKMVKWIEAIEFVRDFAHLGASQGATTRTTNSMAIGCPSDAVRCSGVTLQSAGDHAVEVQTARNSHQLAEAAIARGNHKQAGGWLETTSDYVEDAASWSKQKLDTSESATLRGVRAPRRKVKDGTYWSADEVKKRVDFLGGEIKKLGPGSLTQS